MYLEYYPTKRIRTMLTKPHVSLPFARFLFSICCIRLATLVCKRSAFSMPFSILLLARLLEACPLFRVPFDAAFACVALPTCGGMEGFFSDGSVSY